MRMSRRAALNAAGRGGLFAVSVVVVDYLDEIVYSEDRGEYPSGEWIDVEDTIYYDSPDYGWSAAYFMRVYNADTGETYIDNRSFFDTGFFMPDFNVIIEYS